ncbi:Transposon Ty3-I Gag-Pol polyprotein [Vitis vinifera]|uniref:Transposon Ty3-I Gag-Pol polyprotein n=1 Tax=Vitis vinifera TaxID=29760 RepID=A0A438HRL6_VITVI|nr:Transposon Ty3-I Gag-Pol polyprotein [Vitis vinifera]
MTQEETQSIQNILRSNHDIFAWTHSDMKGIHPSIASHKLNVFPAARPIRQKIRRFHPDRQRVIQDEINKLLEAGFIREVSYPDWLANVVVVPKKEGKWRVCVDYTNLNNACPKDSFPLPRIDQIVDSTSGQGMLSFLDAFSGYHQIPMSPDDEEKTAFITPHGLYCYKVMPFGLKNAGATYQRLMTKIFKPLIGRSVEVYIDDIVVKSKTREQHILHLQEPKRHRSQPGSSQSSHGDTSPRNKKELQRLTGKLVALGRFIARFTDELRPFFLAIRKAGTQGWTDNCQNALERIKHCLMHPPILSSPIPKEKLYMYLAVSEWAISAALFRCPSPKEQKPVYYVSRALADVETSILHKPDLTGRMLQWAIELSEFGIEFQPRLSKKGQVMADFVLEYSRRPNQHHESSEQEWWTLRVDGASRSSGSGVGLVLQSPTGEHLEQAIRLGFSASNNEAEYEAILSGLDLALALSVSKLRIYSDSQLVVRHIQKEYEAKDSRMARYLAKLPLYLSKKPFYCPYVQANPSVAENSTCNTIEATQTDNQEWTHDIAEYLRTGTLPKDLKQAHKIRVQAARFTLIGGTCTSDLHRALSSLSWAFRGPWGMDIVGPLPAAPAQKKFLLVATDYFSKWVEAEAYASIKDKDVTKFHCIQEFLFGIEYPEFILHATLSSKQWPGGSHKQNLINALKKRLEQAKGKWVEELPGVLWAYRTTPGRPTGNTPFALTYGMDAVIPTEIGLLLSGLMQQSKKTPTRN